MYLPVFSSALTRLLIWLSEIGPLQNRAKKRHFNGNLCRRSIAGRPGRPFVGVENRVGGQQRPSLPARTSLSTGPIGPPPRIHPAHAPEFRCMLGRFLSMRSGALPNKSASIPFASQMLAQTGIWKHIAQQSRCGLWRQERFGRPRGLRVPASWKGGFPQCVYSTRGFSLGSFQANLATSSSTRPIHDFGRSRDTWRRRTG